MILPKNWETKEFKKCLETDSIPSNIKIKNSDFKKQGKFPIIDQGEKYIAGYSDDKSKLYPNEGPVVIFGDHTKRVKYVDFQFCIGADGTKVLKPKKDLLNAKFLYYQLKWLPLESGGYSRHYRFLIRKKLVIPTLETQKKIVSILERAEKLKEKRKQASELISKLAQNVFVVMFGDPRGTSNYKTVTLKEVCKKITDGSHYTPKILSEGYPFLTVANMGKGDFYYDECKRISKEDYEKLAKNDCKPLKGDVLFSKDGTVGKVMETTREREEVVLSSIAILRPNTNLIFPTFLAEYLKTDYALSQAIDKKSGSAIRRIVLKDIKTIKIPIPPIEEQKKFVEKIKLNYSIIEKQEKSKVSLNVLFDSLMQKAFNGELVS